MSESSVLSELQKRSDWLEVLFKLTGIIDRDGFGGVTTEQIEAYFMDNSREILGMKRKGKS